MMLNRKLIVCILLLLGTLISAVSGCSGPSDEDLAVIKTPKLLRVGVLPDLDESALRIRAQALVNYLSEELEMPVELVVPPSYEQMLVMFGRDEIDIAYFGGFTFVLANRRFGAQPLVMRDKDRKFNTYFIVRKEHQAKALEDLQGTTFTFGSKLSTSGHLMPRHFLEKNGIVAENFFSSVQYSGTHDKTIFQVLNGSVVSGAANANIVDKYMRGEASGADQLRVLWETPSYTDYVWATRQELSKQLTSKIGRLFLQLERENEAYTAILDGLYADFYVPASLADFQILRGLVQGQNAIK